MIQDNYRNLSQNWANVECLKRIKIPVWNQKENSLSLKMNKIALAISLTFLKSKLDKRLKESWVCLDRVEAN